MNGPIFDTRSSPLSFLFSKAHNSRSTPTPQETEREFKQGRRVEFSFIPELLEIVLGENGENVRRVKEETGVTRIVIDQ